MTGEAKPVLPAYKNRRTRRKDLCLLAQTHLSRASRVFPHRQACEGLEAMGDGDRVKAQILTGMGAASAGSGAMPGFERLAMPTHVTRISRVASCTCWGLC